MDEIDRLMELSLKDDVDAVYKEVIVVELPNGEVEEYIIKSLPVSSVIKENSVADKQTIDMIRTLYNTAVQNMKNGIQNPSLNVPFILNTVQKLATGNPIDLSNVWHLLQMVNTGLYEPPVVSCDNKGTREVLIKGGK